MSNILYVVIGGSLGAVCRYLIILFTTKVYGNDYPWGTIIVNLAGCFLVGIVFTLANERGIIDKKMELLIMTGFLGALTTFSTYGIDSIKLASSSGNFISIGYIMLNNIGGILLAIAGMKVGKLI